MISVNINLSAMSALQNLNQTNLDLIKSQNAISTGKKVATAKDNGAIWAIANKMGSDVNQFDVISQSVDRATSILDTATAAANSAMDMLNMMKSKALAAVQPSLSASSVAALNADYQELKSQITQIIINAKFDGVNMIDATAAGAIALGDADGTPASNITVSGADLSLGGAIITVAAASDLLSAANAATALSAVNASIDNLGTQLATWGAGSIRMAAHKKFVGQLQDALNSGVSSLADADLGKESARLQGLQVRQQLGIQALSIANQSVQSALSLFR